VTAHGRQARRRHASAVVAVRRAAELARRDARLQIRRHALGGLREDAILGRVGRLQIGIEKRRRHLQLRERRPQPPQRLDDARAIFGPEFLLGFFADLRRIQAQPDRLDVAIVRPRAHEFLDVAVAERLLPCHRAVHGDLLALDVLEDAIVGGRRPAHVVLGLQPVDRDAHLQPRDRGPRDRNRTHGACHHLHVQAALRQLRQQHVELAIADERLAADERHVQRLQPIDDFDDAVDEGLALSIGQRSECLAAAKVFVAVGVTARATQRAFTGDFNREVGTIPRQNLAPRADNAFHLKTLAQERDICGLRA